MSFRSKHLENREKTASLDRCVAPKSVCHVFSLIKMINKFEEYISKQVILQLCRCDYSFFVLFLSNMLPEKLDSSKF